MLDILLGEEVGYEYSGKTRTGILLKIENSSSEFIYTVFDKDLCKIYRVKDVIFSPFLYNRIRNK